MTDLPTSLTMVPAAGADHPMPSDATPGRLSPQFRKVFGYVKVVGVTLLVALCAYLLVQNGNQSEQLARRTPTLDYLVCHDQASDHQSIAIAAYMGSLRQLINLGDSADPAVQAKVLKQFNDASDDVEASSKVLADSTNESLPVADAPKAGHSCPTAPLGN